MSAPIDTATATHPVTTVSEWHAVLSAADSAGRAVACFDSLTRTALALPVAHQLRLIEALANGPDLTGLDAGYAIGIAVDAAREELRELDADTDPFFSGPFGFQRPGLAA